jgi:hypothetical protein
MSGGWGPGYGDWSHPTTGEIPRVGDGVHGTGEMPTVQQPTVSAPRVSAPPQGGSWERTGYEPPLIVPDATAKLPKVRVPVLDEPTEAPEEPAAEQGPLPPEARPKGHPALRGHLGPDWTNMPLRLLATAVVALGVLGVSATSLWFIADWINP